MTRDELEFSISQYHDGSLPPLETRAVEELLATSPQAREILVEYQRLDSVVKAAPVVPSLDWDRLHAHLSQAIADVPDEEAPAVRTYKIGLAWTRYIGAAAAVAAAIAIVAFVTVRGGPNSKPGTIDVTVGALASHDTISIDATNGAGGGTGSPTDNANSSDIATAQISVGPSPQVAGLTWGFDDGVLQRPARVVIAGDASPAQDGSSGPFPD
jgi:hypothetical protein